MWSTYESACCLYVFSERKIVPSSLSLPSKVWIGSICSGLYLLSIVIRHGNRFSCLLIALSSSIKTFRDG